MIFIVVFGNNSGIHNYVLYVSSGLVLWFFFANATSQAVGSVVGSAGLLKSLNIPAYFFPLSEVLGEMFNLSLTILVFLILMNWFGLVYSPRLFLIVPCALIFSVFIYGLNLLLSSVNVFFRDIGIIWGTIQPALFFLTPIAYNINPKYKVVIDCNPIYSFIKLGRSILYDTELPPWQMWSQCLIIAATMYLIGHFVFNRLKNQFISAI